MCFSLGFIENVLIWVVIICMIVAIIRVIIPWVGRKFGMTVPPEVVEILGYIMWAVIIIFAIVLTFDLISCVMAGGGMHLLPRG